MPKVAILPGDGIGPEIIAEAVKVLELVAPDLERTEALVGGAAYDAKGHPLCASVRPPVVQWSAA